MSGGMNMLSIELKETLFRARACIDSITNLSMNSYIRDKYGRNIVMSTDFGFWTYNKLLNDIDSILTLILDIRNVRCKCLDSILSIERGALEKYSDVINFNNFQNYEIYLDYLNKISNGDEVDEQYTEYVSKQFGVKFLNRKTRYYLLKKTSKRLPLSEAERNFFDLIFDLDKRLSPKVHNNIIVENTNNYDEIAFLLCNISFMLQNGLKSIIHYLNLINHPSFINLRTECINIQSIVATGRAFIIN